MNQQDTIKIFEEKQVRTVWDEDKEEWYISITDVISVLTESKNPQAYWRKLKQRLKEEGNETVTNCHGLKMKASNGKMTRTQSEKCHWLALLKIQHKEALNAES